MIQFHIGCPKIKNQELLAGTWGIVVGIHRSFVAQRMGSGAGCIVFTHRPSIYQL